ncbi:MAG: fatty acid desaturase family protein [Bacteroidota bacterium]
MRTGKELILSTKPFATENRALSWWHTLSTLFLLAGLLTLTLLDIHPAIRIAASLLSGLVIVRFFVIYHDYQHRAILHKSPVAKFIFTVFGMFILTPPSIWKRSHDYHHNHNSKLFSAGIGSYPIFTKEKFLKSSSSERFFYLFIRHPLTILFGYFTIFIFGMCVASFLSSPRRHFDSLISLVLHVALTVCVIVFLGWQSWLFFILIPFMISTAMGAYLFYAQHNFPGATFKENIEWSYDNAALESSSFMVMNPFWHWVTANIGYHHIHHINSRIPFYRLPEVYREIPEMQKAKTTSLWPGEIIRCFRLKVWDPAQNRMISKKEIFG